jgi:hypothetical protein
MSKKTIKQRIAVVAALALGAGVLSVSPANATANTTALAAGNIAISSSVGTGTANIGHCVVSASASATITTAASLVFTVGTNFGGYLVIESGPATFTAIAGSGLLTSNQTKASFQNDDSTTATLKASAVGSVRVVAYSNADVAVETYAITVVSTCAADTLSLAQSFVRASAAGATATDNVDVSGALDVTNAPVYVSVALNDTYGVNLVTEGAITATVSAGAIVGIDATGSSATAVKGEIGDDFYVKVSQATAGVPATGTVTISFNGTVVGTKSYTIRGTAKSIAVNTATLTVGKSGIAAAGAGTGTLGTTGAGYYEFQYKDSAGNVVTNAAGGSSGNNAATSLTGLNTVVTAVNSVIMPTSTTTATTNFGKGEWSCASGKSGVVPMVVAATNANLEVITSNAFNTSCGDVLDTWAISMDKASYQPGEIATLTLTGKDVRGALVNSLDAIGTVEASFGGLAAVTAPTSVDKFTSAAGVKTYKYAVGLSEGSFVGTFKIAGATDTSAKTVQYKVSLGTTSVTNADVLKSIVALIASINKQIQALQKLILARR